MSCRWCNDTGIVVPRMWSRQGNGPEVETIFWERARTCDMCDGTADQKRERPFCNGSDHGDWIVRNCDGCIKAYDEERRKFRCDLEEALGLAYIGGGAVTLDVYARLGLDVGRDCLERVEAKEG